MEGRPGRGLYPFHDDKHPSLVVDRKRQRFICFACGAKGDVIEFVQRIEGCSLRQALEKLGGAAPGRKQEVRPLEAGVRKGAEVTREVPDHGRFLGMLMPYVPEMRELLPTYREFEVGLSPNLVPRPWEMQRNRIVFPIRDKNGVLVGFSARSREEGAKTAKYIHTGSREGFRSSEHLYGLHRAKEQIAATGLVYITEGFKDVVAMHGAGFTNCVGLMGTALSERQVELLWEYGYQAVILPDGDRPGREAARKVAKRLEREGFLVQEIELPEQEDPDSLLRKLGVEGFQEFLMERVRVILPVESLLMSGLLLYPEVRYKEQRLGAFIYDVLRKEELVPECFVHRELLRDLARGEIGSGFREAAERCREKKRREVEEFVEKSPWKLVHSLLELAMIYVEGRVEREIRQLTRRMRQEKNGEKREELLSRLRWRKSQGCEAAKHLRRPGADCFWDRLNGAHYSGACRVLRSVFQQSVN
ncbi:MAG: CHC2 zinc finger domain-containing protein [Bacteroides sp.]|nr:CHC2 zinc finger domain-containing protein [Bacteroides sp.]